MFLPSLQLTSRTVNLFTPDVFDRPICLLVLLIRTNRSHFLGLYCDIICFLGNTVDEVFPVRLKNVFTALCASEGFIFIVYGKSVRLRSLYGLPQSIDRLQQVVTFSLLTGTISRVFGVVMAPLA